MEKTIRSGSSSANTALTAKARYHKLPKRVLRTVEGKEAPYKGYHPFAEDKTDLRVSRFGEQLEVFGRVYDHTGLRTLSNAVIEVWHLSPYSEKYGHRARFRTNESGEYSFVTDLPNRETGGTTGSILRCLLARTYTSPTVV